MNDKLLDMTGLRRLPITAVRRHYHNCYVVTIAKEDADKKKDLLSATDQYMVVLGHTDQLDAWCRVSGVFYAGAYKMGKRPEAPMATDSDVKNYWLYVARRQYGTHVFAKRVGGIYTITLAIHTNTSMCNVSNLFTVSQLCPAVRIEFRERGAKQSHSDFLNFREANDKMCDQWKSRIGRYWLWFGLLYRAFNAGQYNKLGDRYYTRDGPNNYDCRTWGGVFELTDDTGDGLVDDMVTSNATGVGRFAIYVCAGAKLVVLDQYLQNVDPNGKVHNRTLVQPGGLVVVEGQLKLMAPEFGTVIKTFRLPDLKDDTIEKCIFSKNPLSYEVPIKIDTNSTSRAEPVDSGVEKYAAYDFPVLFLGANESEYGSIAWKLKIQQQASTKPASKATSTPTTTPAQASAVFQPPNTSSLSSAARKCFLTIPEGGRFEAIENWEKEGMAEVRARHRYERLHEANVETTGRVHISKDKVFVVPPKPMMDKILGIGDDRTVYTDIHVMRAEFRSEQRYEKDRVPLPVIYDGYKCTQWPSVTAKPELRPFVKPDWPIVQTAADTIGYRSDDMSLMATGWNQYHVIEPKLQLAQPPNQIYQTQGDNIKTFTRKVKPHSLDVYPYTKLEYGQSAPVDKYDGVHAYVGIDGYHYEKDTGVTEVVGRYNALYYATMKKWDNCKTDDANKTKIGSRRSSPGPKRDPGRPPEPRNRYLRGRARGH